MPYPHLVSSNYCTPQLLVAHSSKIYQRYQYSYFFTPFAYLSTWVLRYLRRCNIPKGFASRFIELAPMGQHFGRPVLLEVPHYASLRGKERELVVLRSDDGQFWREHMMEATDEAVTNALSGSFSGTPLHAAYFPSHIFSIFLHHFTFIFSSEYNSNSLWT